MELMSFSFPKWSHSMPPSKPTFRLFGLNGSLPYAEKVAAHLGVSLAAIKTKKFSDGEVLACADENVRNCDCYIIFSPYTDESQTVNDKVMQTLILIHALRKASARTVTWVKQAPAYDRQDRKSKPREGVTTQLMGMLLDAVYLDRLITLDPHSKVATDNQIRRGQVDVLSARKILADAVVQVIDDPSRLVIQSPDTGGLERTKLFRRSLEKRLSKKFGRKVTIPLSYFDKEHAEEQETVTGDLIVGHVRGCDVLVLDDICSTGGTIETNRQAIDLNGGRLRYAAFSHGYFTSKFDKRRNRIITADEHFEGVEHIWVTDSMGCDYPWRLRGRDEFLRRVHMVDTSELVARALWETDNGGSINSLLSDD
jgi:ribose-phosphate pyrophosphokinase